MDTTVESQLLRLSRLEEEMRCIQRRLTNYHQILCTSWTGRDGQAVQFKVDEMAAKCGKLSASIADLHNLMIQAQSELDEEVAAIVES